MRSGRWEELDFGAGIGLALDCQTYGKINAIQKENFASLYSLWNAVTGQSQRRQAVAERRVHSLFMSTTYSIERGLVQSLSCDGAVGSLLFVIRCD